jgi:hypothetical protein
MYKIVDSSVVFRISDNKQIAPCDSDKDPDFVQYIEWVNEGNTPEEVYTNQGE